MELPWHANDHFNSRRGNPVFLLRSGTPHHRVSFSAEAVFELISKHKSRAIDETNMLERCSKPHHRHRLSKPGARFEEDTAVGYHFVVRLAQDSFLLL